VADLNPGGGWGVAGGGAQKVESPKNKAVLSTLPLAGEFCYSAQQPTKPAPARGGVHAPASPNGPLQVNCKSTASQLQVNCKWHLQSKRLLQQAASCTHLLPGQQAAPLCRLADTAVAASCTHLLARVRARTATGSTCCPLLTANGSSCRPGSIC